MWYPAKVTTPPSETITAEDVKRQCNVLHDDDDTLIDGYIAAARDHVEKYCNILIGTQTVELKCDCFADMARLPVAPAQAVATIAYVDSSGADQSLPTSVFEERFDGFEASIITKYGQQWPATRFGSRITVTLTVGYAELPASIRHAMLLWIGEAYDLRENDAVPAWTAFNALLCNYRRGA